MAPRLRIYAPSLDSQGLAPARSLFSKKWFEENDPEGVAQYEVLE
jgi:hypothetical protein